MLENTRFLLRVSVSAKLRQARRLMEKNDYYDVFLFVFNLKKLSAGKQYDIKNRTLNVPVLMKRYSPAVNTCITKLHSYLLTYTLIHSC